MAASYISVPKDLTKVKNKVVFGLTKRQLLCFLLAVFLGVPVYFWIKRITTPNIASMGMMVVMMPLFFFAMYEKNGQPLEVILHHFIQANYVRPKVRPYEVKNYYRILEEQREEEKRIVSVSKKKRKEKGSYSQNGAGEYSL